VHSLDFKSHDPTTSAVMTSLSPPLRKNDHHLSQKLVHDSLGRGASLFTRVISSYFIGANLGAANFGIVPAIQDAHGVELPVATKVALWKWFFDRAKACFLY
jgi:hypothetical protein